MASRQNGPTGFVHLHVRSAHSHLYGASRLDELIEAARALGYHDLALTDRNGLYGAVAFYQKARQAGLAPIVGVELDGPAPAAAPGPPERAVCLARDLDGYRTLCRLTSARHLNPAFDLAEAAAADHAGVYVLAADARLLARLAGRLPPGQLFALLNEFGDRSTRLRNDGLARAASRRHVPLVAGGAVAFHAPDRFAAHRTLRAIATLTTVADVPRRELAHPQAYLKGPGEMASLFRPWPEAVANTVRLAADCHLDLPLGRPVFPRAPVPDGETPYSHLAQLAFAGLRTKCRPLRPEAVGRIENELAVIDRLGFADYFLILHEIAAWARDRGIPCVARGSAAGSLVAWCLGLSGVDPLRYGLLFERFLNLERADCPDIDLDICWRRRDDVIRHVYDTYGAARVAMISTHQTFQARSAFREVAKAHGLPPDEVDRLSRRLPYYSAAGIRDAVLSFPECRDFPVDRPDVARVLEIAAAIDGLPRHLSVHVGGVVVADRPLTDYLPLQPAAKGVVITQYEADAVEALGLVKMDLLAQRSLSIIATAVREIEKNHGVRVDPEAIADGDPASAVTLERGDTFGCFQIESPGMRNLLKMMGARQRMDVILGLSLIRPGPASSGMKERFVRRRRGLEPPEVLHPALASVLGDTYGVMLYQEDVIRVAHAAAGFTLAEGDRLRKDLAKGAAPDRLAAWRTRFVRGAIAGGAGRTDAETLWDRVAQFAAYSYCKAHACTYGEIAYRAVYLRTHWPAEFAAAVLANQAGYYERRTYLEDARRHGCPVLGPDVNASDVEPSTEWTPAAAPPFEAPPDAPPDAAPPDTARRVAVRMGLMDVRGLSERAMRQIVASRREGGPYRSVADLAARVHLAREEAENLALAGAMDSLAANRPQALWLVHALADAPRSQGPLFAGAAESPPCPDLSDFDPLKRLEFEDHLLGMTPSAHPMTVYRSLLGLADLGSAISEAAAHDSHPPRRGAAAALVRTADLPGLAGRRVAVAGVLFAERRARTRTGEFMKFISLEDEWGVVEAVLLPDAYQRLGARLTTRGPYLVTGTVEDHFGAVSLIVTDLVRLEAGTDSKHPADRAPAPSHA
ncbi:MAG: DNA polymerase III subunit alpha [Planctomycetes bacterium]|nr:DNA polymerase III subunit alpha [Planctomycetota bacterium]